MTSALLEMEPQENAEAFDDFQLFMQEVRQFPLLSQEEERELAKQCAAGDEDAIRKMVNCNLRLVVSVAREYAGRGVPLLDLIQEGNIGLIAAARKYDYTMDFRFSTYATKWIRQGMLRCLQNNKSMIRVPAYTADKLYKVLSARSALQQETGQDPSLAAIAGRAGMDEDKVRQLLELNPEVYSLDAPAGEDEDDSLGILLEDQTAPQPQEELQRVEMTQLVSRLVRMLPERQQLVLRLHFGMEDGTGHSLEEIGGMMGVSKERVRQIEHQAIDRLFKLGCGMGLEDFLNE